MICPGCHEDKPIEAFGKAKWRKEGISYRCKRCNSRAMKDWARRNPEIIKAQNDKAYRKWREQNPLLVKQPFITSDGRLCRTCSTRKPDEQFVKDKRGINGRGWRCQKCANEALVRWDFGHPRAGATKGRIPRAELVRMLNEQDGCCAICRQPVSMIGSRKHKLGAHLDHDHKTGKVRGLLCIPCNTGLGAFNDSPSCLQAAIRYLSE